MLRHPRHFVTFVHCTLRWIVDSQTAEILRRMVCWSVKQYLWLCTLWFKAVLVVCTPGTVWQVQVHPSFQSSFRLKLSVRVLESRSCWFFGTYQLYQLVCCSYVQTLGISGTILVRMFVHTSGKSLVREGAKSCGESTTNVGIYYPPLHGKLHKRVALARWLPRDRV